MEIALLTDLHFGARNDNQKVAAFQKKFYDEVFFPYVDEHGITESKANEGGFGSGKKGHSAWMKDIEWGGNYKQCPICNINTNFTGGKCEICGNSFA